VESVKIVGFCIVAAIVYGILHDLVTANLCVEYFSVFHPPIFHTDSPWLLALGWGVVATWWMGLFLGAMIAVFAQAGPLPMLNWRRLIWPLVAVLVASYIAALVSGVTAFHFIVNIPDWARTEAVNEAHLSPEKQRAFTADLYAHMASYYTSAACSVILCLWILWKRLRAPRPFIPGQLPLP